jgi:hypothetical protein
VTLLMGIDIFLRGRRGVKIERIEMHGYKTGRICMKNHDVCTKRTSHDVATTIRLRTGVFVLNTLLTVKLVSYCSQVNIR